MTFTVEFEVANAYFQMDDGSGEIDGTAIAEVLRQVARRVDGAPMEGGEGRSILDGNGNIVGEWELSA